MNNKKENPTKLNVFLTFVLKYGLLAWGFGSGIAYIFFSWMREPAKLNEYIFWGLTVFPAVGLGAGLLMWVIGGLRRRGK